MAGGRPVRGPLRRLTLLLRPEEAFVILFWTLGLVLWLVPARTGYEFEFQWGVNLIPLLILPFIVGAFLRRRLVDAVAVARDWFGLWSAYVTYLAFHGMVFLVNPRPADGALMAIDRVLFGGDPSLMMAGIVHPVVTWVLERFYILYAVYPSAMMIVIYASGRAQRRVFHECSAAMVQTLYLGYLGYLLVPARGPRYELSALYPAPLDEDPLIAGTVEMWRYAWDCFPSLHTGCSVLILLYAFKYGRRWGLALTGPVVLTVFSCVYLRYHYGIDIIAGIALAWLVFRWTGPLLDWWDAPANGPPHR